ncbi:MAG: hypothetical protein DSY43_06245, partial [Gammaproteobacteria bacterium]
VAQARKVQWVVSDGNPCPGLGKIDELGDVWCDMQRVVSGEQASIRGILFRDPEMFIAGELHNHSEEWEKILSDHKDRETIQGYICNQVNILDFSRPFKGKFKGVYYDSTLPPRRQFPNHPSCNGFQEFVRESVTSRLLTGAVRVWGEVGIVEPPWLVLPLTVEPSKPRLCIDARYLNLWMVDTPFSLDKLAQVPRFVYSGSYMSKLDDKSGYDHLLLTEDSQTYVGFEWEGWWYVNTTLPFGWKNSPFVYQSVGMAAMSYLRNLGVACSLYIDDRLIGELFTDEGKWSRPMNSRHSHFSKSAAETALYITCRLLVALGYTLGLKKCVLAVCCRLRYLGMAIDSNLQAFLIPEEKKVQFAKLRESILALKSIIPLKLVQRLLGKCISFSLAFPGAKFYIREMALAIGAASRRHEVVFSPALRQEVMFWSFLDSWTECIPWRSEKHASLLISTDASLSRWAAVVHHGCSEVTLGDYWEDDVRSKNINVKEMWAVVKALQSLPSEIRDCRLDVKVDNQATIHVWHGRGGRSKDLNHVARMLFTVTIERNISLSLMYVPSALNEADQFSRKLTKADSMLSARCWQMVQNEFGGLKGHNLDLMSLDSNAMRDKKGEVLPHFSPFPTPKSAGVNVFNQDLSVCDGVEVNAYVFPPFSLILPLLRFLLDQKAVVTVVVPRLSPLPIWWPVLKGMSERMVVLADRCCKDAVLSPTKHGFVSMPIPFDLLACRIRGCVN